MNWTLRVCGIAVAGITVLGGCGGGGGGGGGGNGSSLRLVLPATSAVELGDTLAFVVEADPQHAVRVETIPLPANASFDVVTRQFAFTPDESQVGQSIVVEFSATNGTNVTTKAASIVIQARPPGSSTVVRGEVRDSENQDPLPGVTVTVAGTGVVETTDAQGKFFLDNVPLTATHIEFDGATAPSGIYTFVAEDIGLVLGHPLFKGQINVITRPVYLPLRGKAAGMIDPNEMSTLRTSTKMGQVRLDVYPDSATMNGSLYVGAGFMPEVAPAVTPAALPANLSPGLVVAIQPAGIQFSPPASLTFPNYDQLPAGSVLDLWSIDPTTGQFAIAGQGQVSSDGKKVETVDGSGGVSSASWHFFLPPGGIQTDRTNGFNQNPMNCSVQSGSSTSPQSGNLREEHSVASYRSQGRQRSVRLVYNSTLADARPIISAEATIPQASAVPGFVSASLTLGGVAIIPRTYTDTSGLNENMDETILQSLQLDATAMPTGRYPYILTLTSHYPSSSASNLAAGNVIVRNDKASPFGAGWGVAGLQRLHHQADGSVLLTDGVGTSLSFTPVGAAGAVDTFFMDSRASNGGASSFVLQDGVTYQIDVDGTYTVWSSLGSGCGAPEPAPIYPSGHNNGAALDPEFQFAAPSGHGSCSGLPRPNPAFEMNLGQGWFNPTANTPVLNSQHKYSYTVVGTGNPVRVRILDCSSCYFDNAGRLRVVINTFDGISPRGDYSRFVTNPSGGFSRVMKNGTRIDFDAAGFQTSATDRNGNVTQYVYDSSGNLSQIMDPVGMATTFTYQGGLLSTITDPAGRTTDFSHNANGDLVSIVDPDTSVRDFTYDQNHRLVQQVSKLGHPSDYNYGFAGRFASSSLPDGSTRGLAPAAVIGLPTAPGQGTALNPLPFVRIVDVEGVYSDGEGHDTRFTGDIYGKPSQIVTAIGQVTTLARDADGNAIRITLPDPSAVIDLAYDGVGNLLAVTEQAIAATTAVTYEPKYNRVKSVTDPESNLTAITVDANGNPVNIVDAGGTVTKLEYLDPNCPGSPTKITRAVGQPEEASTQFSYDSGSCNLHTVTDPLGRTTTFTYETDGSGNLKTVTDGEGGVTEYTYDSMNRVVMVRDPDLKDTLFVYDLAGNLTTVTDANSNVTAYTYEEIGRLKTTTDPLAKVMTYVYDGNGNLKEIKDRQGQLTTFAYDPVNRLVSKALPGGLVTTYTYDVLNNLDVVADSDSVVDLDYDVANRLIKAGTGSSNQPGVVVSYAYDRNGNRTGMDYQVGASPGASSTYDYDKLDRIVCLTNPSGLLVDFGHDALNRRSTAAYPNGTSVDWSYDGASQLASVVHALNTVPFTQHDYSLYDDAGNRTKVDVNRPPSVGAVAQLSYAYDSLYRLIDATSPEASQPDEAFTYDPVGNLLTATGQATSSTIGSGNRLIDDALFTYAYDDSGNLVTKTAKAPPHDVTTYTYDPEGQLVQIDLPTGSTAKYRYDGLGRRIEKDVDGTIMRYVYDNEDILLEFDGSNTLQSRFTHGVGIDEPLLLERDANASGSFEPAEVFYYHVDGLGSVVDLTDSQGGIVQSYLYSSFGSMVTQAGSSGSPYTYTGREYDPESGLYYYRSRYYDPDMGRFLSEDRIGFWGGINLYAYTHNNPTNWVDPYGEQQLRSARNPTYFYQRSTNPNLNRSRRSNNLSGSRLPPQYRGPNAYQNYRRDSIFYTGRDPRLDWNRQEYAPLGDVLKALPELAPEIPEPDIPIPLPPLPSPFDEPGFPHGDYCGEDLPFLPDPFEFRA